MYEVMMCAGLGKQDLAIRPSNGRELTISALRRSTEFPSIIDEKPWILWHGVLNPWKIKTRGLGSMKKIRVYSHKYLKDQGVKS